MTNGPHADLLCIEPSRALAECEAKRRIVKQVQAWEQYAGSTRLAMRRVAKQLALTYADHPDYSPDWRP